MILTNDQLKNVCEAENVKNFKPEDKFVMINKNIKKEYSKNEIFTVSKIEKNILFFKKPRQKTNRYFIDDSQLICKI